MNNLNISGIYKITNTANNKTYIGSAVNIRKRKEYHLRLIQQLKHPNKHLEKSFNKHGFDKFKFEVIEKVENKNELIQREQFYIDTLNPNYNICRKAGSILGIKRSLETCKKLSISNSGKNQTEEHKYNNHKNRPTYKGRVFQYDLNGNLLKIWDCTLANIGKTLNMNRYSISSALNNINKTMKIKNKYKGFIWKYEKEVNFE